ncbi:Curli production assembly/transport component CsgG [Winogradskyella sp. PE311]|uniref:Curli production assembly/transport component CsgG n=1 Tax=Winogradskyella sp. PE311 TaxID=3366943 RepID=UPI00397EE8C6
MILKSKWLFFNTLFIICSFNLIYSQEDTRDYDKLETQTLRDSSEYYKSEFNKLLFYDYRGTNVFEGAIGAGTLIGDAENTSYGLFYKLGYKRSITDHLLLGLSYNSYNLSYDSIEQELISIDFNIEFLVLPYDDFSPFLFGGFGYNALNDFEISAVKIQAGFGFEYIVASKFGLKLFAEYNYSLDDEVEFLINDQEDDSFLRLGFGINLYFGGENQRLKRLEKIPTKIKTNSILPEE